MVTLFTPGKALGVYVNAHRHGWAGRICEEATTWNCSAAEEFREEHCARGSERCYHLHLFDPAFPRFTIDDNGAGWVLGVDLEALNDQVLLLVGSDFGEPRGLKESRIGSAITYGAYRIQRCKKIELPHRSLWQVDAYPDGWARFANLKVPRPPVRSLAGPYMREIERPAAVRVFEEAMVKAAERADPGWHDPQDGERLRRFHAHLGAWLDAARTAAEARGRLRGSTPPQNRVVLTTGAAEPRPFADLAKMVKVRPEPVATDKPDGSPEGRKVEERKAEERRTEERRTEERRAAARDDAVPAAGEAAAPLLEPAQEKWITRLYGERTLQALRVASLTKPLVILKGNAGVGKSNLALGLLDDPARERTLAVAVAATWRGREDLLGYVNPVSNEFEPTAFTRFLLDAWAAWQAKDRRTRVVVFEELNLSQPEHWLSDVLVVSQYRAERDRKIDLGGSSIRGVPHKPGAAAPSLMLSPAVRFVATMNSDHTTRALSPRVLDRAAVIELWLEPRAALALAEVELGEEQHLAITDLDELLQRKNATFSIRSALSLRACQQNLAALGLDLWGAIDLVLAQEVLSKVRLFARDPADEALAQGLGKWSEQHGRHFTLCSQRIAQWVETLKSGTDVQPA